MARLLFVSCWADEEDAKFDRGEGPGAPGGCELTDVAPETTLDARLMAARIIGMIEQVNQSNVILLFDRAEKANKKEGIPAPDPYKFGSDLAFMAMGHGVSWFDDNAEFEMEVPQIEVLWEHVEGTYRHESRLGPERAREQNAR